MGTIRAIGIEGTGSYGAGLSRFLRERGHTVVEANRSKRQLRRQKAKATLWMTKAPLAPCWLTMPSVNQNPTPARSR